jgi:hypothetical protein
MGLAGILDLVFENKGVILKYCGISELRGKLQVGCGERRRAITLETIGAGEKK